MQNVFYAAIFRLARNLPARKVNLQLATICASWIFSARKLSYFNTKLTKKYISFIDLYLGLNIPDNINPSLYLSINTWHIFRKWTTGIFFKSGLPAYFSKMDYQHIFLSFKEQLS